MPHDPPVLVNLETNEELKGQGVPDQMVHGKAVQWSHAGGQSAKAVRSDFKGAGPSQFEIEMSFETQMPGEAPKDVRPLLKPLDKMSLEGENGHPPICHFSWGTVNAPVLVEDSQVWYTRFDPSGIPTAARVRIRMTEARDQPKLRKSAGLVGGSSGISPEIASASARMAAAFVAVKTDFHQQQSALENAQRDAQQGQQAASQAFNTVENFDSVLNRESEGLKRSLGIGDGRSSGGRGGDAGDRSNALHTPGESSEGADTGLTRQPEGLKSDADTQSDSESALSKDSVPGEVTVHTAQDGLPETNATDASQAGTEDEASETAVKSSSRAKFEAIPMGMPFYVPPAIVLIDSVARAQQLSRTASRLKQRLAIPEGNVSETKSQAGYGQDSAGGVPVEPSPQNKFSAILSQVHTAFSTGDHKGVLDTELIQEIKAESDYSASEALLILASFDNLLRIKLLGTTKKTSDDVPKILTALYFVESQRLEINREVEKSAHAKDSRSNAGHQSASVGETSAGGADVGNEVECDEPISLADRLAAAVSAAQVLESPPDFQLQAFDLELEYLRALGKIDPCSANLEKESFKANCLARKRALEVAYTRQVASLEKELEQIEKEIEVLADAPQATVEGDS